MRPCSRPLFLLSISLLCCLPGLAVPQVPDSNPTQPEKQRPLNVDRDPVASPDGEVAPPQAGQSAAAATIGRDNGKYTLQRNVDEVVLNATVLDDKQHM